MDFLGLGISYLYIFFFIALSSFLLKKGILTSAVTRKIIHIGVSHWWIIAWMTIDSLPVALIGPSSFILINWLSYKYHLFRGMEHEHQRKNLGTIYFPIALTVIVVLGWTGLISKQLGALSMLILGWGDGFAALIGEAFPRARFRIFGNEKSLSGSLSMFVISLILTNLILGIFYSLSPLELVGYSMIIALAATLVEALTPLGLDNISVPFTVTLMGWWLLP